MARQFHLDGMSIDVNKARFSGTFDLDEEDIAALSLDRTAFFVVGVRLTDANFKSTDTGDVRRTDVLNVVDARVADGEMREIAMAHLMGKGGQQVAFAQQFGVATEEQKAEEARFMETRRLEELAKNERPEGVDEDGVVATDPPITEEVSESEVGPRVAKLDADFFGGPSVSEREVVGSVYANGRKDNALKKFMEEF